MKNGTASKLETGQLAELASAIIRQLPHIEGLDEVAQGWIENGSGLKKVLWEALVSSMAIFDQVGIVDLPETGKFIPSEHFTYEGKEVAIFDIKNEFKSCYFSKIEKSQKEVQLNISTLTKDDVMLATFFALLRSRIETTLSNIWELLKRQPNGEPGVLLTKGNLSNVFFVRDIEGHLSAVKITYGKIGWCIDANTYGGIWTKGDRIFSRNS